MNRAKLLPSLAAGVLLLVFVGTALRLTTRSRRIAEPGVVTVRFAHWQLEGGLREAYEAVARRYMELHPKVRIEQIAIPQRVYGAWMRTQLVGGTAPDLIEFGQLPVDVMDELLARNFVPLTDAVEEPNPYNAGTALAKTPWRATFVDGLDTSYRTSNLCEYYKIPTAMFTVRIYYNRALWRQVLGDTPVPRTFAEFLTIARRVSAAAPQPGSEHLMPLAGSRDNLATIDSEFGSQTQRLSLALDVDRNLTLASSEIAVGFLRRQWSSDSPEFTLGLEVSRDLIKTMSPGFMQLTREDATFLFVQQRALMLIAGSWDSTSLRNLAPFELGVFPLPLPGRDDPVYGKAMLGKMSEAEAGAESSFALTAGSKHPEVALDFLRFITSQAGNRFFMEKSHWLPAIIGITPPQSLQPFVPMVDGYPNGFNARQLANLGFETRRLWETNVGLLGAPTDGVGQVKSIYRAELGAAIQADLVRLIAAYRMNAGRQDTTVAALTELINGGAEADRKRAACKRAEIFQQQTAREAEAYWSEAELADAVAK